jgi:hypothetical protein
MSNVVIHIDRLVLHGFRREDRYDIAAGLQQELSQLFADGAGALRLAAMRNTSRLQVSGVPLERGSKPQSIGASVARGIGREFFK